MSHQTALDPRMPCLDTLVQEVISNPGSLIRRLFRSLVRLITFLSQRGSSAIYGNRPIPLCVALLWPGTTLTLFSSTQLRKRERRHRLNAHCSLTLEFQMISASAQISKSNLMTIVCLCVPCTLISTKVQSKSLTLRLWL